MVSERLVIPVRTLALAGGSTLVKASNLVAKSNLVEEALVVLINLLKVTILVEIAIGMPVSTDLIRLVRVIVDCFALDAFSILGNSDRGLEKPSADLAELVTDSANNGRLTRVEEMVTGTVLEPIGIDL